VVGMFQLMRGGRNHNFGDNVHVMVSMTIFVAGTFLILVNEQDDNCGRCVLYSLCT
jgi:hypothetical protein